MTELTAPMNLIVKAAQDCIECDLCKSRCEVMRKPDTSMGRLSEAIVGCMSAEGVNTQSGYQALTSAVAALAADDPDYVFTVRHCCMCGFCTAICPVGIDARETFAAIREIFQIAGVITAEGFESTQVDKEWHIFSVYRAVHGIYYNDLPHLPQVGEKNADTLFFPGCSLASYAPELTREVYAYMEECGMRVVVDENCCGIPLKAAGLGDRERSYVADLVGRIVESGVKRVVTVCPGCMYELERQTPEEADVSYLSLTEVLAQMGVRASQDQVERVYRRACGMEQDAPLDEAVVSTIYDSCYDRSGQSGGPLREIMKDIQLVEMEQPEDVSRCCGAGGAVSTVDPEISEIRAQRVLDQGGEVADLVITNCPTCAYTFAYQRFSKGADSGGARAYVDYLEVLFQNGFDWKREFDQLGSMWHGEYGQWVISQLT